MSLDLNAFKNKQRTAGSCCFISLTICLLTGAFSLFSYNVMFDAVAFQWASFDIYFLFGPSVLFFSVTFPLSSVF